MLEGNDDEESSSSQVISMSEDKDLRARDYVNFMRLVMEKARVEATMTAIAGSVAFFFGIYEWNIYIVGAGAVIQVWGFYEAMRDFKKWERENDVEVGVDGSVKDTGQEDQTRFNSNGGLER